MLLIIHKSECDYLYFLDTEGYTCNEKIVRAKEEDITFTIKNENLFIEGYDERVNKIFILDNTVNSKTVLQLIEGLNIRSINNPTSMIAYSNIITARIRIKKITKELGLFAAEREINIIGNKCKIPEYIDYPVYCHTTKGSSLVENKNTLSYVLSLIIEPVVLTKHANLDNLTKLICIGNYCNIDLDNNLNLLRFVNYMQEEEQLLTFSASINLDSDKLEIISIIPSVNVDLLNQKEIESLSKLIFKSPEYLWKKSSN